jgi:hypothetical protein
MNNMGSCDSSLGVATGYGLDDRSSAPCRDKIYFSIPQCSRPALGPVMLLGREADHSLQASAEVKNVGAIRPFFIVQYLIN